MKKILNVHYTPRVDSHTKKLNDLFLEVAKDNFEIVDLDLVKNPPELLLEDNLNAYFNRNYKNLKPTDAEIKSLEKMDQLAKQLKDADILVLSYPIYNFAMPGVVKLWIDSVIQKGTAFAESTMGPEGFYTDKKALILSTSGGMQQNGPSDFSSPHIKRVLSYVGMQKIDVLGWFGIKYIGVTEEMKKAMRVELEEVVGSWV